MVTDSCCSRVLTHIGFCLCRRLDVRSIRDHTPILSKALLMLCVALTMSFCTFALGGRMHSVFRKRSAVLCMLRSAGHWFDAGKKVAFSKFTVTGSWLSSVTGLNFFSYVKCLKCMLRLSHDLHVCHLMQATQRNGCWCCIAVDVVCLSTLWYFTRTVTSLPSLFCVGYCCKPIFSTLRNCSKLWRK